MDRLSQLRSTVGEKGGVVALGHCIFCVFFTDALGQLRCVRYYFAAYSVVIIRLGDLRSMGQWLAINTGIALWFQ